MTFEERFEKWKANLIKCFLPRWSRHNQVFVEAGIRKATKELQLILAETRESLIAIQEYMVDEQGNTLSDRDANTQQVRIARAAQARLDDFFGGGE